jgi:hypothetical protein
MEIDNTFREHPLLTLILKMSIYRKIKEAENNLFLKVVLNFKQKWQKLLAGTWQT